MAQLQLECAKQRHIRAQFGILTVAQVKQHLCEQHLTLGQGVSTCQQCLGLLHQESCIIFTVVRYCVPGVRIRMRSPALTCTLVFPPMLTFLPSECNSRFNPGRAECPPKRPYGRRARRSDRMEHVKGLRYSICMATGSQTAHTTPSDA